MSLLAFPLDSLTPLQARHAQDLANRMLDASCA